MLLQFLFPFHLCRFVRQMAHNFKSIRLIPSLNGNLYKFDGDDIEQLPITADDLLRSSFQFPDELVSNLVISGEVFEAKFINQLSIVLQLTSVLTLKTIFRWQGDPILWCIHAKRTRYVRMFDTWLQRHHRFQQ